MLLGFKVYQQNLKALVIPIGKITAIYNNKNSCNFFLSIQKLSILATKQPFCIFVNIYYKQAIWEILYKVALLQAKLLIIIELEQKISAKVV